ncbi:MAG: DUF5666 domain-containing protein [Gammaproteobacteria bacterium]|nr:DUF5666 domain-containing protein [Gammaproteobacteria bacterium]
MKPMQLLALTAALTIAACGGSNEQTAGIDARGNPVRVGVVSKGTITGFGSIIVNDVTFDTGNALFGIDGRGGSQSDLAVGDVVVVVGTINDDGTSPVADTVTFDDVVEGPITDIDLVAETLTVLGQLVRVDADTSFDDSIVPAELDGLNLTDIIEISGFVLADGSVSATRIELKPAGGELEITGDVSNVVGTTFEINGLVVDFSAAMLENFPSGAPEDGHRVEAKGDSLNGAGQLAATRVEYKGNDLGEDGDLAELEGFITRFASASDFDVEGVQVTTSVQTAFENGTSADLALNRKVEVEGEINAAGVLIAANVEIKASGFVRIESLVEAVGANQLTVLGIVVRVNASTRLEDKSAEDREPFNLSHIVVGNYVEIRGYENAGGVVATLLEREDFQGDVALRGFVEAVNDPEFTILGVDISTGIATDFVDVDGSDLDAAAFFSQALGRLVEASGTLIGASIDAGEVEFEN